MFYIEGDDSCTAVALDGVDDYRVGVRIKTRTHLATKTQWLAGIRILPPGVPRGLVEAMGGVAGIIEACSRGSASSGTGLVGVCVARSSKRVPHLRGLTVVAAVMVER